MAEAKDIDFGNGVQLTDWGEGISFDGVYLQFGVSIEREGDWGVGYFSERKDAELFAKAKSVQDADGAWQVTEHICVDC